MHADEATFAVIAALNDLKVPYMLVGSMSSNFFGIERATRDADFVVQLDSVPINAIMRRLGSSFHIDPQMRFETVTGTTMYRMTIADSAFKVELFQLSDDPHDQARFARRVAIPLKTTQAFVQTAEDVVVMKLRWSAQGRRKKDMDDVENVVAVQGERLDWPYIYDWCEKHGTRELAERVRRSIPPLPPVE